MKKNRGNGHEIESKRNSELKAMRDHSRNN